MPVVKPHHSICDYLRDEEHPDSEIDLEATEFARRHLEIGDGDLIPDLIIGGTAIVTVLAIVGMFL